MAAWVAPAIIGGASVLSSILGSGGSSTSNAKKHNMATLEQRDLLKQLIDQYAKASAGPSPSAPKMFTEATDTEKSLTTWARSQAVQDMLSGKVPYDVGPEYAQKYYEEAIKPGMIAEWEDIVKPQIRESYAGPGYWSTARMRQESESGEQLARDLSAKRSELMYSEELAKRQAVENAMNRIPGAQQAVSNVATMERDIEHEKVMDSVTRFLMGEEVDGEYQPANNPNVAIALQLLGITQYAIAGSSQSQGPNAAYGVASGLSQGLGTYFGQWLGRMGGGSTTTAATTGSAQRIANM